MGDAVAVADATGRITYVNLRYEELTGRRPSGLPPEEELGYYTLLAPQPRAPVQLQRELLGHGPLVPAAAPSRYGYGWLMPTASVL